MRLACLPGPAPASQPQKGAMTVPELSEGLDLISIKSHNWWAARSWLAEGLGVAATLRMGCMLLLCRCTHAAALYGVMFAQHPLAAPSLIPLSAAPANPVAAGMCRRPAHSRARGCWRGCSGWQKSCGARRQHHTHSHSRHLHSRSKPRPQQRSSRQPQHHSECRPCQPCVTCKALYDYIYQRTDPRHTFDPLDHRWRLTKLQ